MRALGVCIILAVFLPLRAYAQPAQVTRVLRTFDFEERRLGNEEDLPMHWLKVEGPGLPHYVNGLLSKDRKRSGDYSFRFDLNGGSLIYRYSPGQIRVEQGAHYRIQAFCETTVLPKARARLTAYLTDLDGHPLPATVRHSVLYAATKADETWHPLEVEVSADDARVGYLVLELELLQPELYEQSTLGQRSLFVQDIHGSAWFDDVTISQVPVVTLSTDHAGNIFCAGDPIRLHIGVSDRFTEDLQGQLIVKDATGNVVFQKSGAIDLQGAERISPGNERVSVDMPTLPAGWYQVSLEVSSQGQPLGEHSLNVVLLADGGGRADPDPRFGIVATHLPFQAWPDLPQILPYLAAGRVKLSVWSEEGDVQELDAAAFDHLLEQLQSLNITPTACLLALPPSVAREMGGKQWTRLLTNAGSKWKPELSQLIARHANHLDRWQLGDDGSDAFANDPLMLKVYDAVYAQFSELVNNPDLAMPWPAWYELHGTLPATVALSVPSSVLPEQLPLYTQELRNVQGHNLSLSIQLLDQEKYGREESIRDLAKRMIYAMSAGANRVDLPMPFSSAPNGAGIAQQPQELFMIERTLTMVLSGAVFEGHIPLGEGIDAFLFDRGGEGVIALWNRGNKEGVQQLALNMGEHAMRVDLWGNITPVLQAAGTGTDASIPLVIGADPIFLLGIDGPQAQLRATVSIDQPLLESSFEAHTRRIRFSNPYHQAISGSLKLKAPKGWTLNPPTFQFTLNPGENFDRDFTIQFPYNSFAGTKTLNCEFVLQADRTSTFVVPLTLKLGLSDVGMESLALRDGNDVVVQQMITNYGDQPINYNAFAIYPGQPRQERLISNLDPGKTVLKRYRFADVPFTAGTRVRVGVKELDGMRILNDEVEIR